MQLTMAALRVMLGAAIVAGPCLLARAAEPLMLTCESAGGGPRASVRFRIDLDRRTVELLEPSGFVMASTTDRKMNASNPSVRITDAAISWNLSNNVGSVFDGSIDRENGNARTQWMGPQGTYANAPTVAHYFQGRCQRAAQRF
jgi:hypothetical protein